MRLNITKSTLMAHAYHLEGKQENCHRPRWWWVLPTAAKIENVFDMTKYRVSNELSMILVNIINILTIDVKYY